MASHAVVRVDGGHRDGASRAGGHGGWDVAASRVDRGARQHTCGKTAHPGRLQSGAGEATPDAALPTAVASVHHCEQGRKLCGVWEEGSKEPA